MPDNHTAAKPHDWRTDQAMGYAEYGREWCKDCGLVRNAKNEAAACLGKCCEMISRRNRPATSCMHKVVTQIDGKGYCKVHFEKHLLGGFRAWAEPLFGTITERQLQTLHKIAEDAAKRAAIIPLYRRNENERQPDHAP